MRIALALALLLATPVAAQSRLIGVVSGDWNGDGLQDAALLYAGDGNADLVMMEGDDLHGLREVLRLPEAVYAGPMAGQAPTLEPRSATSFAIISTQIGIGRTPWVQTITVAWRDEQFVVAGFDYDFYDRLDLTHGGSCSVNLLTGAHTFELEPGDGAPSVLRDGPSGERAFALADLNSAYFPSVCGDLFR